MLDDRVLAPARLMRRHGASAVAVAVLCGIAWASGFRAYMSELAGFGSTVDWTGTFGPIILPGALVGGLLGWAWELWRRGGPRGWRWLALAPLAFAIAPLLRPGALSDLLREGIGGAAIGVALLAIAGGRALSGRGRLLPRILCGVLSALLIVGVGASVPAVGGARLDPTTPRGVWVVLIAISFTAGLALASSIPQREAVPQREALPQREAADAGRRGDVI
jgi:hypothetical protein